ncbi:dimethylaniline monooxygenase [N-oxide-forming] 2-like [Pelobates cultripes]|uniref:Flavin-containing monooxygenase n=1 Tax=Pelobates cultripes TaxID=61616 RepID=A0AAD1SWL5_PELCU|nr:dimethylaniline monooxygenase [N-oxide-forming] 2-like [Pelobates cultripes]
MVKKRVAIIGAGVSGLSGIKSCLEEGLEPTCFERRNDIGGLWNFTDKYVLLSHHNYGCLLSKHVEDGCPSIYKSLVSNISKETFCFSDFPMPENFPNFLPNAKYLEYCKLYAEHFQLLKYIKFKTTVCQVQKHSDFDSNGQWVVTTENDGEKATTVFDAVTVCSGQYVYPLLPLDSFPDVNKFKGKILHCREYKEPMEFDGKKVLIIGLGNSGADLASELCTRASQVYLSSKRGVCMFRRLGRDGYPFDLSFITRFQNWIQLKCIEMKEPLVNEELPSRILAGLVIMKPGITKFTETSAQFVDGTTVDNLDVVIFATGYEVRFPFLDESVIQADFNEGFLYKNIFPVNLQKPTLFFIGFIQPVGSIAATVEIQNRWAMRLFKEKRWLQSMHPGQGHALGQPAPDFVIPLDWRYNVFNVSKGNCRRVNYIEYMDDLASNINAKPNIMKLLLTDPVLGLKIFFGTTNPYQYRLTGPGKWAGAREAILTQWDRIEKPMAFVSTSTHPCTDHSQLHMGFKQPCPPTAPPEVEVGVPHIENGRASIYQSVVTNTSKEMMCFSDFPFPENSPNFLHNTKLLAYYRAYADQFDLLKHIHFKTLVCSVKKCPDFLCTGQWNVIIEKNGKQETLIFDAVMVCSGHHEQPFYPLESFPGIKRFKGEYFHSRQYKNSHGFEGKRVLIVGMGNSAADIAVEISRTASQVFLSTRRGAWVMSRVYDQGFPWDICFDTRFQNWIRNTLPTPIIGWLTEKKMNTWFDHANFGLQPCDRTQFKEPLLNDEIPSRITCGFVTVKPNVKEFSETAVTFNDGTVEEDIHVIIFATGYAYSFPFLDESLTNIETNKADLYKCVIPPNLEKPTLGIIGLIQPLGPIMPTSELQARWLTSIIKGICRYPSVNKVLDDIAKKKETFTKRFGTTRENRLQVDFIEYLDDLASDIGVKPNIWQLFLTDPILAVELFFGPCTPVQYRLTGPGKWNQARKQILTTRDRIVKSTKSRVVNKQNVTSVSFIFLLADEYGHTCYRINAAQARGTTYSCISKQ